MLSDRRSKCNPVGCDGTNLTDMETFITEHVLEESDDKGYFSTHVAGFSLSNSLPTSKKPAAGNNTGNATSSNSTLPGNSTTPVQIGPKSSYVATVWYSNQVR